MKPVDERRHRREEFRAELRAAMANLGEQGGVYPADQYSKKVDIGKLRRRGGQPPPDPTQTLTLIENVCVLGRPFQSGGWCGWACRSY